MAMETYTLQVTPTQADEILRALRYLVGKAHAARCFVQAQDHEMLAQQIEAQMEEQTYAEA